MQYHSLTPLLIACLMLAMVSCGTTPLAATPPVTLSATPAPPTVTPIPPTGNWALVWADEFDGPNGSSVDPARWSFNVGGGGWGNGELQTYTDSTDNAYLQDGVLMITAQKDEQKRYTSARLVTRGNGDWLYGRFEVKAKLPHGQGIWPAIWLLPTDLAYGAWPNSGEIDLMEMLGHEPARVYGTLHYGKPHQYTSAHYDLAEGTFTDDFHIFTLEWEPGEIRWYVDDNHYQTQTEWFTSSTKGAYPAPFDQRFYLITNVAVGGAWPGYPDETTEFPQTMAVDYVRVYQKSE